MAAQYVVGDFVVYRGENIAVIDRIIHPLSSYRSYEVTDIDSGRKSVAMKHELSHTEITDVMVIDDVSEMADFPVKPDKKSTAPKKERFAQVTEKEIEDLANSRLEKSTKKQTAWAVKILREWLVASGRSVEFEDISNNDLNEVLRAFYAAVKTADGEVYLKSSMINICSGINRHLTCLGRVIDITNDKDFTGANLVFSGVLKKLRKDGLDVTQHKKAIPFHDMQKLYQSGVLGLQDPVALQNKVFVELSLHFVRRGREGLRELRKDSFRIEVDASGKEYVCMAYHEKEKNHQGGDVTGVKVNEKEAAMYAVDTDDMCPVKSFKLYLEKLNPGCVSFYQTPNMQGFKKSGIWYKSCPMGVNAIGGKMADLSKKAKLSRVYTNHCLRATAATVLGHKGAIGREIIAFTGHRHEHSLLPYIEAPSETRKQEMSNYLHDHGKPNVVAVEPAPPLPTLEAAAPPRAIAAVASPLTRFEAPAAIEAAVAPALPEAASCSAGGEVMQAVTPIPKDGQVDVCVRNDVALSLSARQIMQGAFYGANFSGNTTINFNMYH